MDVAARNIEGQDSLGSCDSGSHNGSEIDPLDQAYIHITNRALPEVFLQGNVHFRKLQRILDQVQLSGVYRDDESGEDVLLRENALPLPPVPRCKDSKYPVL